MIDQRLLKIYKAAGRLFNTRRYANTKVAEIAAEAGIATGTVYNLFTSKKAILTFVIRASLDRGYLESDITLPIEETDRSLQLKLFEQASERMSNVLNITDSSGTVCKSFREFISEFFDALADYLPATNNIEFNANILKELASSFFPARTQFFNRIEDILNIYMKDDRILYLEYPQVHVQSIIDILTWWANNAYVALPDVSVPREKAKKIAVDILVRAYTKNG